MICVPPRLCIRIIITILLLFIHVIPAQYTCSSQTITDDPQISGESVTITDCTFTAPLTITNPTGSVILRGDSVFHEPVTITGNNNDAAAVDMEITDIEAKKSIKVSHFNFVGPTKKLQIKRSTLYAVGISDSIAAGDSHIVLLDTGLTSSINIGPHLNLTGSSEVVLTSVTVPHIKLTQVNVLDQSTVDFNRVHTTASGVVLHEVFFVSTRFSIRNSHLVTTASYTDGNALRLVACQFAESAQLSLEDTIVESKTMHRVNVIVMHATKNVTNPARWVYYSYMSVFDTGSVFNCTNLTVAALNADVFALASFYTTIKSATYHRRSLFSGSSKFIATNSRFLAKVNLFLTEGSTAVLDAASYEGIDIDIVGDSGDGIVIPIPHTISVTALTMANCRPLLSARRSNVAVARQLRLTNLLLDNGLALHCTSVGTATITSLRFHNSKLSSGSLLHVHDLKATKVEIDGETVVAERSVVKFENCSVSGGITFDRNLQTTFIDSSSLLFNRRSSFAYAALSNVHLLNQSWLLLDDAIVTTKGLELSKCRISGSSRISISSSTLRTESTWFPALEVTDTIFNGGHLCVAGSTLSSKVSYTPLQFGVSNVAPTRTMFTNGSTMTIKDSRVGLDRPQYGVLAAGNGVLPWKAALLGNEKDNDGASPPLAPCFFTFQNSSFVNGKLALQFRGNDTKVIVDSLALQSSDGFELSGDMTTVSGTYGGPTFYLPSKLSIETLKLEGGTVRWLPKGLAAVDELLRPAPSSTISDPVKPNVTAVSSESSRSLLGIEVGFELKLVQPLRLELEDGQQLRVKPKNPSQLLSSVVLEPSRVSDGSLVHVADLHLLAELQIGGKSSLYDNASNVLVENCTAKTIRVGGAKQNQQSSMMKVAGGSMILLRDVVVEELQVVSMWIEASSTLVLDQLVTTKKGLTMDASRVASGGQVHVVNSSLNATAGDSLKLNSVLFEDSATLLRVADSTLMPTYAGGVAVRISMAPMGYTTTNGAAMIFTGSTFTKSIQAISAYIGGLFILDKCSMSAPLMMNLHEKGTLLFGSDVQLDTEATVSVSAASTTTAMIGCTSDATPCDKAVTPSSVNTLTTAESSEKLSVTMSLVATAAQRVANEDQKAKNQAALENLHGDKQVQLHDAMVANITFGCPLELGHASIPNTSRTMSGTLQHQADPTPSRTLQHVMPTFSATREQTHTEPRLSPTEPLPMMSATFDSKGIPLGKTSSATQSVSLPMIAASSTTLPIPPETPQPVEVINTEAPLQNTSTAPSRKRSVVITSTMLIPGSEEGAVVVLSTSVAANAAVSSIGSGGAGVIVVAGSVVRVMNCGLLEDDARPALHELPFQFALGSSNVRFFVGAILAHTIVQCMLLLSTIFAYRYEQTRAVKYFSMAFCGLHGFFTPTIFGGCTTVLSHSDGDGMSMGVAALCFIAILAIHLLTATAVHLAPQNGVVATRHNAERSTLWKLEFQTQKESSSSSSSDQSSSVYHHPTSTPWLFTGATTNSILMPLYDGCRVFEKPSHRHYATVETTLASVIAIISGARPSDNCNFVAFGVSALALTGLLYVILVRPLRTKLDTTFSITNNLVLIVLCASVSISLQRNGPDDDPPSWVASVIIGCLWLLSALAILQLVVQGYWALHTAERRRRTASDDSDEDHELQSIGDVGSSPRNLTTPLLQPPYQRGSDDESNTSTDVDDDQGEQEESSSGSDAPINNVNNPLRR